VGKERQSEKRRSHPEYGEITVSLQLRQHFQDALDRGQGPERRCVFELPSFSIPASRRWSTRPAASTSSARNTRPQPRAEATTARRRRRTTPAPAQLRARAQRHLDSMVRTCNAARHGQARLRSDQSATGTRSKLPGARRHDRTRCPTSVRSPGSGRLQLRPRPSSVTASCGEQDPSTSMRTRCW